jgi:uncharacterized protein YbaR (Trm112 family)
MSADLSSLADVKGHLDVPFADTRVQGFVQASGWVLTLPHAPAEVDFLVDGQRVEGVVKRIPRPDVLAFFPDHAYGNELPGFVAPALNLSRVRTGRHNLAARARLGSRVVPLGQVEIQVFEAAPFYQSLYNIPDDAKQREKLDLVLQVLACPGCKATLSIVHETQLRCRGCGYCYPVIGHVPVMIQGKPEYPIEEEQLASPPSNNPYPINVAELLHEVTNKGGVALEVGSGRRHFAADRLIQLEICKYPFTDVVNQGERLPFRDNSIDLILCLAVTEHVLRPWVLAAEIERVLKKGGSLIIDSAFMQPIHGYPSHFFNMTGKALASLFRNVEIASLRPEEWQHPWISVNWILTHILADIPEPMRARLTGLTLEDLLAELKRFCDGHPNLLSGIALPDHRIEELAAGFTLVGRKCAA